jgi:hypothetical protein
MKKNLHTTLSAAERTELIGKLKARFALNPARHPALQWDDVEKRLLANPGKIRSLHEMEETGGEPDVVRQDRQTGEFLFYDCSAESPAGRRNTCFDRVGWESRKEARPENTAMDLAAGMGIGLLTEEEYLFLQTLGPVDRKTSSWLATPAPVRELGGALFGDFRYARAFIYHNGAQSYYAARGFRGSLRV